MKARFSLAGMLLLLAVSALAFGWWVDRTQLAMRVDMLERSIESMRPDVERKYLILGLLDEKDVTVIEAMVHQQTNEPILRMRRDRTGEVEVMTGKVRGPLDGGGASFLFRKQKEGWEMTAEGGWVS